jgi:hypothetical protein
MDILVKANHLLTYMKTRSVISILAVVSVFSCKEPNLFNSYRDIGSFSSWVEGQNRALALILDKYGSLSTNNKPYKVKYTNNNAPSSEARVNALWYNKSQQILALEISPPDGAACHWKNVTRDILERATKSSNGMLTIDSLAVPGQPTNYCLR